MKRVIFFLCACLLAGCSAGRNAPQSSEAPISSAAPEKVEESTATANPTLETVTIDPEELKRPNSKKEMLFEIEPGQVIVDQNGIKITTLYSINNVYGPGFRYKIENNTGKSVFSYQYVTTINGYDGYYMRADWGTASPGVGYGEFHFDPDLYRNCGINTNAIGEIGGQFYFEELETRKLMFESKPFTLKTNKYDQMSKLDDEKFETVYDDNSITVRIAPEKKLFSDGMLILVTNKMKTGQVFNVGNFEINGQKMNCLLSLTAAPGGTAVSRMQLFRSQLSEAGITDYDDINSIKMSLDAAEPHNTIELCDYSSQDFEVPFYTE